jgi:hypothetical protein
MATSLHYGHILYPQMNLEYLELSHLVSGETETVEIAAKLAGNFHVHCRLN